MYMSIIYCSQTTMDNSREKPFGPPTREGQESIADTDRGRRNTADCLNAFIREIIHTAKNPRNVEIFSKRLDLASEAVKLETWARVFNFMYDEVSIMNRPEFTCWFLEYMSETLGPLDIDVAMCMAMLNIGREYQLENMARIANTIFEFFADRIPEIRAVIVPIHIRGTLYMTNMLAAGIARYRCWFDTSLWLTEQAHTQLPCVPIDDLVTITDWAAKFQLHGLFRQCIELGANLAREVPEIRSQIECHALTREIVGDAFCDSDDSDSESGSDIESGSDSGYDSDNHVYNRDRLINREKRRNRHRINNVIGSGLSFTDAADYDGLNIGPMAMYGYAVLNPNSYSRSSPCSPECTKGQCHKMAAVTCEYYIPCSQCHLKYNLVPFHERVSCYQNTMAISDLAMFQPHLIPYSAIEMMEHLGLNPRNRLPYARYGTAWRFAYFMHLCMVYSKRSSAAGILLDVFRAHFDNVLTFDAKRPEWIRIKNNYLVLGR